MSNYLGGGGDDWVYADDGNDYVNGGSGQDDIYRNNENDELLGGSASSGLVNSEYLYGGAGNDFYCHDFS